QSLVDLSDLPVTAIDRIELYRGVAPLELGPVTPGGAVNIVTLPAAAASRVLVSRGSFGTWRGLVTGGARRGGWSATAHGGYEGTRGDFGFLDDNGTPFNAGDDADTRRENAGFDSGTLLGTVRGELPAGVALAARASVFRKTQGVPGIGAIPTAHTRLATDRTLGQLELSRPASRAAPGARVEFQLARDRSRFRDPEGELG